MSNNRPTTSVLQKLFDDLKEEEKKKEKPWFSPTDISYLMDILKNHPDGRYEKKRHEKKKWGEASKAPVTIYDIINEKESARSIFKFKEYYYAIDKKIGAGGFGTLKIAEDLQTREKYIIKTQETYKTSKTREKVLRTVQMEIEALRAMELGDGLIKGREVKRYGEDELQFIIIMNFVPGKNLADLKNITFDTALHIATTALNDLDRLHENGFYHNDIKLENIIYDEKEKIARLIDFGCASKISEKVWGEGQTNMYMAPELIKPGAVVIPSEKTEVYAMGLTLAQKFGFLKIEGQYVINKNWTEPSSILEREAYELLRQMTAEDPRMRPSVKEVQARFNNIQLQQKNIQKADIELRGMLKFILSTNETLSADCRSIYENFTNENKSNNVYELARDLANLELKDLSKDELLVNIEVLKALTKPAFSSCFNQVEKNFLASTLLSHQDLVSLKNISTYLMSELKEIETYSAWFLEKDRMLLNKMIKLSETDPQACLNTIAEHFATKCKLLKRSPLTLEVTNPVTRMNSDKLEQQFYLDRFLAVLLSDVLKDPQAEKYVTKPETLEEIKKTASLIKPNAFTLTKEETLRRENQS